MFLSVINHVSYRYTGEAVTLKFLLYESLLPYALFLPFHCIYVQAD